MNRIYYGWQSAIALISILLIAAACNNTVTCMHCEGCTTISTRLVSNDSLIYDTTLCSAGYQGVSFQDTVQRLITAQTSPTVNVQRHDTSFNCQNVSVKSKDAAALEAKGWYCQYRK